MIPQVPPSLAFVTYGESRANSYPSSPETIRESSGGLCHLTLA